MAGCAEAARAAYGKGDAKACWAAVTQAKIAGVSVAGAQGRWLASPSQAEVAELVALRECLEYGVLLSLQGSAAAGPDVNAFRRNYAQLSVLYARGVREHLGASEREWLVVGLNLMLLLVEQRIADFHQELELIDPSVCRENPLVQYPVQLEVHLSEGSYNRVLAACGNAPDQHFGRLAESMAETVREEVAECIERAYDELSKDACARMLGLQGKELDSFLAGRGWPVDGKGRVRVAEAGGKSAELDVDAMDVEGAGVDVDGAGLGGDSMRAGLNVSKVPAIDIIQSTLMYAKELERIV